LALGYPHPDYLLADLDSRQMAEWEAYNRLQPIGAKRLDFYFAYAMMQMTNLTISVYGKKGARQTKFDDFYPNWTGEKEEKVMSVEEQKAFWKAFAERHNKRVRKEKDKQQKGKS